MTEKGLFKLDDTLVSLANDYLRAISTARAISSGSLGPRFTVSLFGSYYR
jgi:hypothetical protein